MVGVFGVRAWDGTPIWEDDNIGSIYLPSSDNKLAGGVAIDQGALAVSFLNRLRVYK
jgi:hypothetical protein